MKKILIILMLVLMVSSVSAATVSRVIQGNTISYTVSGAPAGKWGGIIKETIPTGYSNPTLVSGIDIRVTGNLVEIPFTHTSLPTWTLDGTTTTTITGEIESNQLGAGTIVGDSQLGGGGPGCTDGETQSCTVGLCAGTQTCSGGSLGNCVKNDATCGTCSCDDWSECTDDEQTRTCTPSECDTEVRACGEDKCEFYEKEEGGDCVINTGLIVLLFVGLFALRMFSN